MYLSSKYFASILGFKAYDYLLELGGADGASGSNSPPMYREPSLIAKNYARHLLMNFVLVKLIMNF